MLPVSARWHPPDTGQSTASAPVACTKAPSRFTSASSVVDISSQTFPFVNPCSNPSSASITAADAAGEGKQVITTSQADAISFGLSDQEAPSSRNGCATDCSRSRTITSCPLRIRLPANLPPTLPRPINPIFISMSRYVMLTTLPSSSRNTCLIPTNGSENTRQYL